MSILIGIKGADSIRYISTEYPSKFEKIVNTLKTFYKAPETVKALIDLGNLDYLGISPHKKSKGGADVVNCESRIRDRKLSPGKHGASIVRTEEEFIRMLKWNPGDKINCCFLYEDNKWYILVGGHKENISTIDVSVLQKSKLMEGLNVYEYEPDSQYNKLSAKYFASWDEVRQSATENNNTYYIFRGEKFLTAITPSQKQSTQEV